MTNLHEGAFLRVGLKSRLPLGHFLRRQHRHRHGHSPPWAVAMAVAVAVHGVVVVLLRGGVFLHDVGEGAMPHPRRDLPHHHNATETRNTTETPQQA